jgi:hypothetical protein
MPWNVSRSAQFYDKEVLKFPPGLDAIKSVVLDATNVTVTADTRNVLPAGTILAKSATNTNQYVAYTGGAAKTIKGILARPVDILAQATNSDEPAPMFYHLCVFATSAIVGFTQYASALVADLNTCKFE